MKTCEIQHVSSWPSDKFDHLRSLVLVQTIYMVDLLVPHLDSDKLRSVARCHHSRASCPITTNQFFFCFSKHHLHLNISQILRCFHQVYHVSHPPFSAYRSPDSCPYPNPNFGTLRSPPAQSVVRWCRVGGDIDFSRECPSIVFQPCPASFKLFPKVAFNYNNFPKNGFRKVQWPGNRGYGRYARASA